LLEGQADLSGLGYLDHAAALLHDDPAGRTGVEELRYIMARAAGLGFADRVTIDPTLARGLDYYTGPIFEAKAHVERFGGKLSFAGGGRYDDLIELYGGMPQGAVGFSFGVERLIELLKEQAGGGLGVARPVLIAPLLFGSKRSEGFGSVGESAERLAQALRAQGIAARIGLSASNPGKHLQYAEAAGLEWIVFVGEDEVSKGLYPLRQLSSRSEDRLSIDGLIERLRGLPL
ncbi:MAG TPA: ATP phosphoribosyltransferase regulatory subunit, partial [Pseudomonadota bacterium]|nr:ATP phosphoribosyltransferase regulatory subunit [Pseudomonadota bacterium]